MSSQAKKIEALEQETFESDDHAEVPPSDIVAYNELRSCADLFRMYEQGILDIQPEFQRDEVWPNPAKTRFVDSLTKQLPIPSMCFAQDHKKQKWIVIDGLQRITTIVKFLSGGDWRLSQLDDVDPVLSGASVAELKNKRSEKHHYYTRVENLTIPITVLRCDLDRQRHLEYLFTIFHRLNTGGMRLNNQEIRNCIYGGPFNSLLKELDSWGPWRRLNRMQPKNNYRLVKQELILRALAFNERFEDYTGHLAKFLNDYMHENRRADPESISRYRDQFQRAIPIIVDGVFGGNPPPKLSTTVAEALLVGVLRNLNQLEVATSLSGRYEQLVNDNLFSEASLAEGLSKRQRVIDRLGRAVEIFAR